jgi:hypothetical protein
VFQEGLFARGRDFEAAQLVKWQQMYKVIVCEDSKGASKFNQQQLVAEFKRVSSPDELKEQSFIVYQPHLHLVESRSFCETYSDASQVMSYVYKPDFLRIELVNGRATVTIIDTKVFVNNKSPILICELSRLRKLPS